MKKHASDDREAALVTLLKRFYASELTEGQLLRALRRDVTLEVKNRVYRPLGLEVSLLPRKRSLLEQALVHTE